MRKILATLLTVFILAVLLYQFRSTIRTEFLPLFDHLKSFFLPQVPCSKPIPYTLGTFDTQFNISKADFLSAISDAEKIWEKTSGINLFTYTPTDSDYDVLKINLIYDSRQQATSKLADISTSVKDNQDSYNALKVQFTTLTAEYEAKRKTFAVDAQAFNQEQQAYQNEVTSWNRKGGAPKADYDRLQAERVTLDAKSKELQATQTQMNNMADEINSLVSLLNRLASTLNLSVEKYNTVGASRGESFEEGLYRIDGSNREIDIYEFSDRTKLVRVLAHELGHALDLEHVADPKAIMYKFNQGNNQTLTTADLSALKAKCRAGE